MGSPPILAMYFVNFRVETVDGNTRDEDRERSYVVLVSSFRKHGLSTYYALSANQSLSAKSVKILGTKLRITKGEQKAVKHLFTWEVYGVTY